MAIFKKLTKIGNSTALLIDRPILDLLNMTHDTRVEIALGDDGKSLVIRAAADSNERSAAFDKALQETNRSHGGVLKKLSKK